MSVLLSSGRGVKMAIGRPIHNLRVSPTMYHRRLFLLLLLLVAGCGDDGGGEAADAQSVDTQTADTQITDTQTAPDADIGDATDGDTSAKGIPPGCNPLAYEHDCLLPYPSNVFLVEDAQLPSGSRVSIPDEATSRDRRGGVIDPTRVQIADGFSHHPVILAYFPEGVDPTQLASYPEGTAATLTTANPTLLLNADTGELVEHFAELDANTDAEGRRALFIRPLNRLENEARYIVALQGLQDATGAALEAPRGFREVRDGEASADPILAPLATRYDAEVFPTLTSAGVARDGLTLAWDFTVQSQAQPARDMLQVRALTVAWLEANEVALAIEQVEEAGELEGDAPNINARLYRRVRGTFTAPLFMATADPGSPLYRGADGAVAQNLETPTVEVPFVVMIPLSLVDEANPSPGRVVHFGHGFFGGGDSELEGARMYTEADTYGWSLVATDWWGMSRDDLAAVVGNLNTDPSHAFDFTDRIHQGIANHIVLAAAMESTLPANPALQLDGVPLIQADGGQFYGISQGHILGGVYAAISPHVRRAALSVGGASFTLLMSRAQPFATFFQLMRINVSDPLDAQKFVALSSTSLDRVDPITYAPYFNAPLPGSQPRRVLMHDGIGDYSVPNIGTHLHARALGLGLLSPTPRALPGLEEITVPTEGADISALLEVRFDVSPLPEEASRIPEGSSCVHSRVRHLDLVNIQLDQFWRPDGVIVHPCGDRACARTCD